MAGFYTCEVSNNYQILTSTGFVRVKNSSTISFFPPIDCSNFVLDADISDDLYENYSYD